MELSGKRVVVVGGGLAGLTAAYDLARRGAAVTLLERRPLLGGLARAGEDGSGLELYYHFICGADTALVALIEELGLGPELQWTPARTAYHVSGRLYPFTTPLDILRFPPLSLRDRLRFGRFAAQCRSRKRWEELDEQAAETWLRQETGPRVYDVIWRPLLELKFGGFYPQVSAAWFWHRLWRASQSRSSLLQPEKFGWLLGGTQSLLNALAARLREHGAEIRLGEAALRLVIRGGRVLAVTTATEELPADAVIQAVPLPDAAALLPPEASTWQQELLAVDFLGVRCLRLRLDQSVSEAYWVNVNNPQVAFNGFIEYSRLNPHVEPGGALIYIPMYLAADDPRYHLSAEDLTQELLQGLSVIAPGFEASSLREAVLTTDPYAQAVTPPGFRHRIPGLAGPVRGAYLLDSSQLYPSDRCLSGMVRLARRLVTELKI